MREFEIDLNVNKTTAELRDVHDWIKQVLYHGLGWFT